MNTLGTNKGTNTEGNYRQYVINCLGENDRRKYFSIQPFGEDANVPEEIKALTSDSNNKDNKFVIGYLNALKLDDLEPGEKVIFSTADDGSEIKAKITFKNTGDIEVEATNDINITVTGDANISADGDVLINATQLNVNSGNLTVD